MDKKIFIAIFLILIFVSTNCNASSVFHRRKLVATEHNNASVPPEVSPTGSTSNGSNSNSINTGKSQQDVRQESQMGNPTNSNMTSPIDSKGSSKNDNDTKTAGAPSPPVVEKNDNTVEKGNEKSNVTPTDLGNNNSCEGSMVSCRVRDMVACIQTPKDSGFKDSFLVVKNEGEITLEVNVQVPNDMINGLPSFEVPKHKTRRINISSTMGKTTELIVSSGNAKCVLPLIKSVSVDNLINQLSFYSKQITPTYAVYASFIVALLFGGAWACCRLSKRNQQNQIPYQELEMGLPESSSAVNADGVEAWDDNWDDDWDEDSSVKSPSENRERNVSADGIISRNSKKDGWDDDWED